MELELIDNSYYNLPILLARMNKNFNKEYAEFLKPYGLGKLHAFYLLCLLKNKSGLKLKTINDILGCDKANTSRAISDMENKGIILRDIENDSERKYNVILTELGRKIAQKFHEIVCKNINSILSKLTEDEVNSLLAIINKIVY